ncbi:hypothetical protein [Mycoplasma sp. 005V]|uniref:hypothetical protein n=1 Tax=unclassified Mycoplasma TaxID=2683645 RepID=UPI003A8B1ACC
MIDIKNPDEITFFKGTVIFYAVWMILIAQLLFFSVLKFAFNFWIRVLICSNEPIHRFPEQKSKILSFLYKNIYVKPSYDLENEITVLKQPNQKLMASIINLLPIFNLVLILTGLGLILNLLQMINFPIHL